VVVVVVIDTSSMEDVRLIPVMTTKIVTVVRTTTTVRTTDADILIRFVFFIISFFCSTTLTFSSFVPNVGGYEREGGNEGGYNKGMGACCFEFCEEFGAVAIDTGTSTCMPHLQVC
jgi:hypothetical protein